MQRFANLLISIVLVLLPVLSYAQALTIADYTNSANVMVSSSEFEENLTNNDDSEVVTPKGLAVTKTADTSGLSSPPVAGEPIVYTITAENIGLLDLTNIVLSDTIIPALNIHLVSGDDDSDSEIDADEAWVYQGVYFLTQMDLDTNGGGDGDIDNTVTVFTDEVPDTSGSVEVPIQQVQSFTVDKTQTGGPNPTATENDQLDYTITLFNDGNTNLTGVTPVDTLPDGSLGTLIGPVETLSSDGIFEPGETWTYTISYSVTQPDIDAGADLVNIASVSTTEIPVAVEDIAITPIALNPSMTVDKASTSTPDSAGNTLVYTFDVINTGNVNISAVMVTDPKCAALPTLDSESMTADTILEVGEAHIYSCTSILVTQAEVDAGQVDNSVVVTGAIIAGTLDPATDSVTIPVPQFPSISLHKVLNALSPVDLGNGSHQITYDIEAENTGNVTLLNLQIEDSLVDMINTPNLNNAIFSGPVVSSPTLTPNPAYDGDGDINMLAGTDMLQVGEVATLSVTFTFTPDVYFGPFDNTATVIGVPSAGAAVEDTAGDGFSLVLDATTPITLGWFKASELGVGEVLFEWITEVEVATAGFYLWSEDADGNWSQINTDMIASQGDSLSSQHYQYLVTGVSNRVFAITDVGAMGEEVTRGPFELNEVYGSKTRRKATDWKSIQRESEQKQQLRERKRQQELKHQLEQLQGMHHILNTSPITRSGPTADTDDLMAMEYS